jgi:ubiquinone/menaquinone biosynthesis C-methylase UbiE
VIATDASADQIAHAGSHPRIEYRVAPAEASGLKEETADLVAVAQAMHWLDATTFFGEARRVTRAGGIVAVWGYRRMMATTPAVQRVFDDFYGRIVGSFWPPERSLVEDGYRSLVFPFDEISAPPFELTATFTAEALARHVGTWSATARFREQQGYDPVPAFRAELDRVWPADSEEEPVRWPGAMRLGRRD